MSYLIFLKKNYSKWINEVQKMNGIIEINHQKLNKKKRVNLCVYSKEIKIKKKIKERL